MIKLLITLPCKEEVAQSFAGEFSDRYEMVFAQGDHTIIARELENAEVIIGEPAPQMLCDAKKLKWMQIRHLYTNLRLKTLRIVWISFLQTKTTQQEH